MLTLDDHKFFWTKPKPIPWQKYSDMNIWCTNNISNGLWRNSRTLGYANIDLSCYGFANEELLNWFKMVWD